MTSGKTEFIPHECPVLAGFAPDSCRVETTSVCLSNNPEIEVTGCTVKKRYGIEVIPHGSRYYWDKCYVAKIHPSFFATLKTEPVQS